MQLSFTEFVVYICVVSEQINKLQVVSGMEEKTPAEAVRQLLAHVMDEHAFGVTEVPENDTRGLHEHAQDILQAGKVVPYVPDTSEPVEAAAIDMLSEGDSYATDPGATQSLLKKTFPDKWEVHAQAKAKNAKPKPTVKIDPNVPN